MALHFLQCWYAHSASGCLEVHRRGEGSKSHHYRTDDLTPPEKLSLLNSYSLQKADTHTWGHGEVYC